MVMLPKHPKADWYIPGGVNLPYTAPQRSLYNAALSSFSSAIFSQGFTGAPRAAPSSARTGTISAAENREIDIAIATGKAIPSLVLKGRDLFDKQADAVLNPILPDVVLGPKPPPIILAGGYPSAVPQFPPSPLPAPVAVPGPQFPTTGSSYPVPLPHQPTATVNGGKVCMNLSDILGGFTDIAKTVGGLASTYYQVKSLGQGPQIAAIPQAVNPARPQFQMQPTAAMAMAQTGQYTYPQQFGGLPIVQAGLPAVIMGGGALALNALRGITGFGGGAAVAGLVSNIGKVAAIAAATGLGMDLIDGILKAGAPKRRRRRLLTKSDIADISTMASLLGKGSEAFKTWLAVSNRSRG